MLCGNFDTTHFYYIFLFQIIIGLFVVLIRFVKILRCSYLVNDVSIGVFNRLYLIKSIQSLNGQFEPKKPTKRNVDNWRHYFFSLSRHTNAAHKTRHWTQHVIQAKHPLTKMTVSWKKKLAKIRFHSAVHWAEKKEKRVRKRVGKEMMKEGLLPNIAREICTEQKEIMA